MSVSRKVAAFIAFIGWSCLFGSCVVHCVNVERIAEEDARYVRIVNGTDRTFRSFTIGHNYQTNDHVNQTLKPGESSKSYKRGPFAVDYGSVFVNFKTVGDEPHYAHLRNAPQLDPGKYVFTLIDGPSPTDLHVKVTKEPTD